ncbi:hypothetical protein [Pseudorhodoferax soli]|uniref:hypothetical protein n=1 Tax=Pseudorhodoferax soli TaxID=545864 RepID=UPI000DF314E1|nr:hypothetical protein [Pseudorhodoferax soli]
MWLGSQYSGRVILWLDTKAPHIRGLIFASMGLGPVTAFSIPQGVGEREMVFAPSHVAVQVKRTAFTARQSLSDEACPTWSTGRPVLQALLTTFLGTHCGGFVAAPQQGGERGYRALGRSRSDRRPFPPSPCRSQGRLIATAVRNDLAAVHPRAMPRAAQVAILLMGPPIHLLGSAVHETVVCSGVTVSHIVGAIMLQVLMPFGMAGMHDPHGVADHRRGARGRHPGDKASAAPPRAV